MSDQVSTVQALIQHKHNLSDAYVARECGVTRMAVGNWRRGIARPTGVNLLRLSSVLVRYEPTVSLEDLSGVPAKPLPSEEEVFRGMAEDWGTK